MKIPEKLSISIGTAWLPVKALCDEVKASGITYDYIVGVARNGLFPAQALAYALNISQVDSCYRNTNGEWVFPDVPANAKLLIVDYFYTTGETCNAIHSLLPDTYEYADFAIAVVQDVAATYPYSRQVTYVGAFWPDIWINLPWEPDFTNSGSDDELKLRMLPTKSYSNKIFIDAHNLYAGNVEDAS